MAVNESRSMNANLAAGLTDGRVKRVAPNWGGDDADVYATKNRNDQLQEQYGAVTYGDRYRIEENANRFLKLSERPPKSDYPLEAPVDVDKPLIP